MYRTNPRNVAPDTTDALAIPKREIFRISRLNYRRLISTLTVACSKKFFFYIFSFFSFLRDIESTMINQSTQYQRKYIRKYDENNQELRKEKWSNHKPINVANGRPRDWFIRRTRTSFVAKVLQFSGCENRKGIYFISREIPAEWGYTVRKGGTGG